MLTIQILTKNNENTIKQTLDSIARLNNQEQLLKIIVGDYGSTDQTVDICRLHKAEIYSVVGLNRAQARNKLIALSPKMGNYFWLNPWESIVENHQLLQTLTGNNFYVTLLHNNTLTYDIRLWCKPVEFVNPIFETISCRDGQKSNIIIASHSLITQEQETSAALAAWKNQEPFASQPYYYEACWLLSNQKLDDFLRIAEHYFFLEKNQSMSKTMLHYYYALIQLIYKKAVKPTMQNLNLCLCAKPLMAEFWCLMGDVYYHLLNQFDKAKHFYEIAIILGSQRKKDDIWPMDISKYRQYPNMMIKSCEDVLTNTKFFANISSIKV